MKLIYRHFIALVLLVFCTRSTQSQELTLGEKVPELEFNQVLNYSQEKLKLKELKGKLIIFDFWSFWCASCIKNFPKMASLQEKYKDRIQIILVNRENKDKTAEYFKNRKHIKMPENVPLITTDSILKIMFEHVGVPYYAWVNETGEFLYSTHETITPELIEAHFRGEKNLFDKKSNTRYINTLFEQDYAPYVQYGTILLRGIDTLAIHLENNGHGISSHCRSITDLYQFAYNESDIDAHRGFREHGRTILEVSNKDRYKRFHDTNFDKWRGDNGYYYESILPVSLREKRYKIMQEDLQRFFGLKVIIEKRPVKCLTLIRTSTIDKLKTKGGNPARSLLSFGRYIPDSINYRYKNNFIRNKPFIELVDHLKKWGNLHWNITVVDSTKYNGNIDFEMVKLKTESPSIEDFRKALIKYDLDLVENDVVMDVLILRD